jgi:hypothetical protein
MKSPTKDVRDESPCPYQRANTILCHPFMLGGDSPVWRFWCEWCEEFHTHGCGEGWRVCHCTDRGRKRGSPYLWGGYYLKLDPRFEESDVIVGHDGSR